MRKTLVFLLCMASAAFPLICRAQTIQPDAMPAHARADRSCAGASEQCIGPAVVMDSLQSAELTIENLYKVLDKYEVKFKKIVAAQALLETGNFTSELCLVHHNLFGLRHPSDGSYYEFNTWEESVKAYHDDVQYKYVDGDYYRFLNRIGYAEDRNYTSKVRRIADKLEADDSRSTEHG